MRGLIYTVLIALANNVDNIGVRIAYSLKGIKMSTAKNLWISVITFIISTLAAFLGGAITGALSRRVCGIFSMAVLTVIGIWFIVEPFVKKKPPEDGGKTLFDVLNHPEDSDMDDSKEIDFREATILGVSLSINNVGGCLSAGIIGLNAPLVGLLSAAVSFVTLWAGNYLTRLFIKLNLGRIATVAAGIILVAIGIKQLF